MTTIFTPVDFLKKSFTKGHLRTNTAPLLRVIGFHLYEENAIITNLLRKLFVKTKIMGAKPLLMLVIDGSTYKMAGRCHVWTAFSEDHEMFRIVYADDAYDVFHVDVKNKITDHLGTAKLVYFPLKSQSPFPRAINLTEFESDADELMSHILHSARSFYSSSSG